MIHKIISFTVFLALQSITVNSSRTTDNSAKLYYLTSFDRIHILVWIPQQTGAVRELIQYRYNSIQRLNNMNV